MSHIESGSSIPGEYFAAPELTVADRELLFLGVSLPLKAGTQNDIETVPPKQNAPLARSLATTKATSNAMQIQIQTQIQPPAEHVATHALNIDQILFSAGITTTVKPRDEFAVAIKNVVSLIKAGNIEQSDNVSNSRELIASAIKYEQLSTKTTNKILSSLDTRVPLSEQKNKLRDVFLINTQIQEITIAMLELPREFYLEHASDTVRSLVEKLVPYSLEKDTKYAETEKTLLIKAELFLIISLMKLSKTPNGSRFVKELNDSLSQKGHIVEFQIRKKAAPSSIMAYTANAPSSAIVINQTPKEDIRDPSKMSRELALGKQGNSEHFRPGSGSSSLLAFPIWPETQMDTLTDEFHTVMKDLLHSMTPEEAMKKILSGGFSFTKDSQIFYTPAHIEVSHELIHVLHNNQGVNTENVEMSGKDRKDWNNWEERTTIEGYEGVKGTQFSENSLGEDYGLPSRFGHNGLPATELSNEHSLKMTLRQLSGAQ